MLLTLPDILSPDDLRQARQVLADAPWADGRESAGSQAREAKNNQQLPHDCEAAQAIRNLVLRGLDRNPRFFSAALPLKVFMPRINRYGGPANAYGNHIDNAVRVLPDGQRVRTDISCTVFLNDPADYDGGELVVADTYGEHRIKLPAGHAVIYPGTSLHQVKPVTRGERLACFFWVQSMVRSDEQRRLLFDLDMNLLALRQRHGETPETTALTGTYHNLLRQWADT
ncbi:Fe2+-dependent dioxygenase [Hydrogenophaga sp.]|uniref:Fe2+-dependent dioxygenase n=1 Tax=Hydrogenophaga sp. TaxID=1904254 RepID=UPI0025C0CF7C|nr:Fe2+-dependent dioxygenase [Hydrogenophaga sp.]MBT9462795.1 Fe2+-dependent dioxygenase [Hydrogenophaga sp.]